MKRFNDLFDKAINISSYTDMLNYIKRESKSRREKIKRTKTYEPVTRSRY